MSYHYLAELRYYQYLKKTTKTTRVNSQILWFNEFLNLTLKIFLSHDLWEIRIFSTDLTRLLTDWRKTKACGRFEIWIQTNFLNRFLFASYRKGSAANNVLCVFCFVIYSYAVLFSTNVINERAIYNFKPDTPLDRYILKHFLVSMIFNKPVYTCTFVIPIHLCK